MKINRMIVCVALMLISVGLNAKTENVWIQGSVGKLSAVVQTPDGLTEGEKCPVVIIMHGFMGNKDGMLEKLTGHSQGGVVASMTAGDLGADGVKCVVLLAPAAVLRDDAIRGSSMGARYNPLDPPELIPLFGDLKLGGEYIRTAFSLPIYETARKYTGPACIIHGTGDQVVPYTYGKRYHYIWPDSELHILHAADHGFSMNMQEVVDLTVNYLIKNLK